MRGGRVWDVGAGGGGSGCGGGRQREGIESVGGRDGGPENGIRTVDNW